MGDKGVLNESLDLPDLERLIHEPARLSILTHLYVISRADFVFLMHQTGLTRGNLSSHMSKLEEAGLIEVEKEFVDRKPMTLLQITEKGREVLLNYQERMRRFLEQI